MPFIIPPQPDNCTATTITIEKFNLLVEKYKHVIDNDATARCMIGFAAANIIRNDGHMDLYSIESWLESIDMPMPSQEQQVPDEDGSVDKIMSVLTDTTGKYRHGNPVLQDQAESANDIAAGPAATDTTSPPPLHRYASRGPYTSSHSYPVHVYVPARIHVNHPLGNLFLPLESSC